MEEEWLRSPEIRKEILLDAFVVMPNHIHGIVGIVEDKESHCRARLRGVEGSARSTLGSFMAGFKAYTTRRVNQVWQTSGRTVWQPSFYDHVIRSERGYDNVQHYIATNVLRWAWDENHPERILKEQAKQ